MKEVYKPHPIALADTLRFAAVLLAAPILADLVRALVYDSFKFNLGFEVTAILIISAVSLLRLRATKLIICNGKMICLTGVLLKCRREIPFAEVLSISLIERPLARLFSSCQVHINTVIAERQAFEIKITLRKADAQELSERIFGCRAQNDEPSNASKASVFAAISSSAIVGFVSGIPIISKVVDLFCRALVSRNERRRLLCGEPTVIGGTRWLSFRQIYCRKRSVCEIKLSQSIFDKRRGTCTVRVTVMANHNTRAKIRRLNYKKCLELLQKNNIINE